MNIKLRSGKKKKRTRQADVVSANPLLVSAQTGKQVEWRWFAGCLHSEYRRLL